MLHYLGYWFQVCAILKHWSLITPSKPFVKKNNFQNSRNFLLCGWSDWGCGGSKEHSPRPVWTGGQGSGVHPGWRHDCSWWTYTWSGAPCCSVSYCHWRASCGSVTVSSHLSLKSLLWRCYCVHPSVPEEPPVALLQCPPICPWRASCGSVSCCVHSSVLKSVLHL